MEAVVKYLGIPGGILSMFMIIGYLGDSRWVDDSSYTQAKVAHHEEHKVEKAVTEQSIGDLREQVQQVQKSADKNHMMTAALVCKVLQKGTPIGENCVVGSRAAIPLKNATKLVEAPTNP